MGYTLKYMFISLLTSVFIIFIIWFAMLVNEHPNDFYYYHLNLEATFDNFADYFRDINLSIYGNDFTLGTADNFIFQKFMTGSNSFINKTYDKLDSWQSVISALSSGNKFFDFIMTITGVNAILNMLSSFVKLLLLVVYLVVLFINNVALGINFIIALGGAISHPYWTYYLPPGV